MTSAIFITLPAILSTITGDNTPKDNLDVKLNHDIIDEMSVLIDDSDIVLIYDDKSPFYSNMPKPYVKNVAYVMTEGLRAYLNNEGFTGEVVLLDPEKDLLEQSIRFRNIPNPSSLFLVAMKHDINLKESILITEDSDKYAKFAENASITEIIDIKE